MRRIFGLVVAMAIALSIALIGGVSVSAESNLTASDECIRILKIYEGFEAKPYWDYNQWTVGYGTRCPADKLEQYKTDGITEDEAEKLLTEFIDSYNQSVNWFANKYGLTLTQNQFDALVLFSFNCGSGWVHSPGQNFHKTMASGSAADPVDIMFWFGSWSNAGGRPLVALINRRMSETNMYLNGVYDTAIPENYNYVIYDANGGSISSRVHTYNLSAELVTPVYTGFDFLGWFTEREGGTQVTALDNSTDGRTLYAHWESNGTISGDFGEETIEPVTITVTDDNVNLRKGPGTNYSTIGQADTGEQFTISKIATGGGRIWGGYGTGWICLQYTDYESVKDAPAETPTEPTEPTEPAPTEPAPTEPAPTEPAPTEPAQPSEPAQPQAVTGKVKANGGLNIRSGAGTGYSSVGMLNNGDSVTILEQKSVGSAVWGKITQGWISMSYVVLDNQQSENPGTNQPAGETTSETGYIKVSGCLNIRSGAGTTYSIVGTYNNGQQVTVTQKQTVGSVTWGKTDKGWISLNYFTTDAPANTGSTGSTATDSQNGTVKVSDSLRIRSGPGTSYAVSGYYNNGEKVVITEKKTVNGTTWGKTNKGWISLDYVELDQSASQGTGDSAETTDTRTVTASCLNVRSAAGTGNSVVAYLYAGAKVQILEETTIDGVLWGKISSGWICLQYTA